MRRLSASRLALQRLSRGGTSTYSTQPTLLTTRVSNPRGQAPTHQEQEREKAQEQEQEQAQEQAQEQEPTGALFSSPFHRGTVPRYLRPPLPPTGTGGTPRSAQTPHGIIDYSQFNGGFHSSRSQDQINQLHVAIAIGNLTRATAILLQVEKSLAYCRPLPLHPPPSDERITPNTQPYVHRAAAFRSLPTLDQVIHPSVFTSLLRKLLSQAIHQQSLSNQHQSNLLQSQVYLWLLNFKLNGPGWAQVDHHLIAGILKVYSVLDYMPWVLPHSSTESFSPPSSTSKPPTLTNILDSITFLTSQTKSFFGKLDKHEALAKIKSQAQLAARQDVLKEIAIVERNWSESIPHAASSPLQLNHPPPGVPVSLSPVRKPAKPTDDPNLERPVPLRLSHLLSNVSTIPESAQQNFISPYDRQMVLEYAGYDTAEAEWFEGHREFKERGVGFSNGDGGKILQAWMWQWWTDLKNWLEQLESKHDGNVPDLEKEVGETDVNFIKVLNNSLIAKVAVVEVIREMSNSTINDGAKSIGLFIALGKAIENEWYAQTIKSIPELNQKLLNSIKLANQESIDSSRSLDHSVRKIWKNELGSYSAELKAVHGDNFDWTIHQRSKVGALVMKGLLATAKVNRSTVLDDGSTADSFDLFGDNGITSEETQPAFYQTTQYFDGKRVGVTKMNEAVAERLDRDPANVSLHPRYLPMVSQPLPWTHPKNGAYLVHGAPLMRTRDSPEQMLHLLEAHRFNGLESVYKALDKLGTTGWKINKPIFEIMSEVWNSGIELAGIPIRDPHLNVKPDQIEKLFAPSRSDHPMSDPLDPLENDPQSQQENPRTEGEKKEIYRSLLASRRSAYGQRCSVNYQLEIARAYLNETFYFPHNIDFRGRAYPIPANLNHIGDDISRGLLKFSEEKELGPDGLRWLKIHVSNKYGNDKSNLADREKFIDENLDNVFDSVDEPLKGTRWWLQSEDPWQTLAACIELTSALRSREPTRYRSSLPIHQDGSCNGLQHYAALGGDVEGGKEVNLIPGQKPGDVYSKVAIEVNKLVDQDAANGHDIAKALRGHIKRKVVKQTVMTTVYGVTFVGAREQIKRQLKDLGVIPIPNLYISAAYVATLVLRSIGEVFKGAVAIQKWLTTVARLVSKSIPPERVERMVNASRTHLQSRADGEAEGENNKKSVSKASLLADEEDELMTSMTWTTPLGLVVCQPYRAQNRTQVKTVLQTVFIADPYEPAQADSRSQASAFPPNFIHSLDATHMMLTALACQDITFASVHDSYWTHASDVDTMNVRLRDSFIKLHTTRILENLSKEIKIRYAGYQVPKNVLTSRLANELKSMGVDINNLSSTHTNHRPGRLGSKSKKSVSGKKLDKSKAAGRKKDNEKTLAEDSVGSDNSENLEEKNDSDGSSSSGTGNHRFILMSDLIPPLPPRGKLDIQQVIHSKYFFA